MDKQALCIRNMGKYYLSNLNVQKTEHKKSAKMLSHRKYKEIVIILQLFILESDQARKQTPASNLSPIPNHDANSTGK